MTNRDGEADGSKGSADVGGHVVIALDRVLEDGITIRHQAREEVFQITPHIRIGVFLDQQ